MKILFCGTVLPEKYDTKLKFMSPASNRFQINFCKELERQGHEVEILSFIGFPMESNINLTGKKELFTEQISYIIKSEGFIKSFQRFYRLLNDKMKKADYVVTYNVVYIWLFLGILAKWKKKYSVLILADYSDTSSCSSVKMKTYAKLQYLSMRQYDFVVGLSSQVKYLLNKKQKHFCMEGGISDYVYHFFSKESLGKSGKLIIMYAGLLEPVTGVDLLLDAFHDMQQDNAVLWISGKGSLEAAVLKYAQKDQRIHCLGYMEYNEYLSKLAEADVLINPRNMNLKENQNNFPSKIMEYLASGKTILSTKFRGYENFEGVINFCESDAKDIRINLEKILLYCRQNQEDIYKKNREFASRFLWMNQIKILLNYLNERM